MINVKVYKTIRFFRHYYYTIKKLMWCSWVHKKYRCYPVCLKDQIERGANPDYYHCDKCFPCHKHDGFDLLFPESDKWIDTQLTEEEIALIEEAENNEDKLEKW